MSAPKWTPAQNSAIVDRGGSLLVSAAAGSGKTAVLVERVIGLLRDPQKPMSADRLLILTFTNAAAAELRARIYKRLTACIAEAVARDSSDVNRLRHQRMLLQRADIGTIDSYCIRLLHTYFSALELPPDFETVENADLARIRQECLNTVLERAYEDPDFRAFADLYGRGRDDGKAGDMVLALFNFLSGLPDPHRALERYCAMWERKCPLEQTEWFAVLREVIRGRLESAHALACSARDLAEQSTVAAEKYRPVFMEDVATMENLLAATEAPDAWERLRHDLGAVTFTKMPAIRGGKDEAAEISADLRKDYKKILDGVGKELLLCTAAEDEADRAAAAPLVRALAKTVLDFEQTFYAAKLEEKLLEFSDFERLTLRLLQGEDGKPTPLAAEIAGGIDAVMVDEYQDSNALQDRLYHLLANPAGDNLFFVGDLKQSIYRFRHADPTIFVEKQDTFLPLGQGYPAQIALDANFRSAPAVVNGINYLFDQMMSRELGGVDYGPGQRLVVGSPTEYTGLCRMQIVEIGDCKAAQADARAVAAQITKMIAEKFPVRDSGAPGGTRPCRPGDFCILLRTRGGFGVYAAQTEAAGLPVHADVSENLLDSPQVRPFAALLRVLDNPAQDICLASVMLSALFGFEPDDLVRLRADFPRGSLYGAVLHSERAEVRQFYKTLSELRRLAQALPVDALLEELLARTGYLAAVGALPDGESRRDELRGFTQWAAGAGKGGLSALVRAMDAAQQSGEGVKSASVAQTRPGCVAIMTIHRSKGLEFPVVFVAEASHQFNTNDLREPVLFHGSLGVGLNLRGKNGNNYNTLARQALRFQVQRESQSELMRVLYVALTRAKDALILSIPLRDADKTIHKLAPYAQNPSAMKERLFSGHSWAEWLIMAGMRHPDASLLRDGSGMVMSALPAEGSMEFERLNGDEAEQPRPERPALPTAEPDAELVKRIRTAFEWRYPHALRQQVPVKVSVTALTHEAELPALERPAFMYKEGLTGAERGTALHRYLQNADLDRAPADPRGEAERQQQLGLLDPALFQKLDYAALEQFFKGPTFERIRSARQVLREYDFITAVPAATAMGDKQADYGDAQVLVQGVADVVLVFEDHAEILDYKTDRNKTPEQLLQSYAPQLWLYRAAVQKRLSLPVTRCTLYSFALDAPVDVPLL